MLLTNPILEIGPEFHRMRTDTPRSESIVFPPSVFRSLFTGRGGKEDARHSKAMRESESIDRFKDLVCATH